MTGEEKAAVPPVWPLTSYGADASLLILSADVSLDEARAAVVAGGPAVAAAEASTCAAACTRLTALTGCDARGRRAAGPAVGAPPLPGAAAAGRGVFWLRPAEGGGRLWRRRRRRAGRRQRRRCRGVLGAARRGARVPRVEGDKGTSSGGGRQVDVDSASVLHESAGARVSN